MKERVTTKLAFLHVGVSKNAKWKKESRLKRFLFVRPFFLFDTTLSDTTLKILFYLFEIDPKTFLPFFFLFLSLF